MVGRVGAEESQTQSNIIFPSARPQLKLLLWISLIPTYNSGIKQDFNYTKHFGKKKWKGGLQMWKNSFCLLWTFGWARNFWAFLIQQVMILEKQGIGNVDYSKNLLA